MASHSTKPKPIKHATLNTVARFGAFTWTPSNWRRSMRASLGVVQHGGRYLLVTREVAEQVVAIDARQVALLVDPAAAGIGDDGVPDDLMW